MEKLGLLLEPTISTAPGGASDTAEVRGTCSEVVTQKPADGGAEGTSISGQPRAGEAG